MKRTKPIEQRFWPKVARTDGCWLWTGATNAAGYGLLGRGRRGEGNARASHVSYELAFGPIPDGLWVLHRCDNPRCVRPDHLFLGTHTDNMADAKAKGRMKPPPLHEGERCHLSKLTESDVRAMRELNDLSERELGRRFGVSRNAARSIRNGLTWKGTL